MTQQELSKLIDKVKASVAEQVGDDVTYHLILVATDETGCLCSMAMRCGIETDHDEPLRYALGAVLRGEHTELSTIPSGLKDTSGTCN